MSRGRLVPPDLDDRTWQDIVDEARALIPTYAPEWTDHNPSDLGIALIELFAWLVEGMIYRLNRVPERNYIAFLNLLGITRDPAIPATTLLAFRAVDEPVPVPAGSRAATPQTESEPAVVFESDEPATILPVRLSTALLIRPAAEAPRYEDATARLLGATSAGPSGLRLTLPAGEAVTLALGFDAATREPLALRLRLTRAAEEDEVRLRWRYARGDAPPDDWPAIEAPDKVEDGTEALQRSGVIAQLAIPPDWGSQKPAGWPGAPDDLDAEQLDEPRFWVGMEIANRGDEALELTLAYLLFNSVPATNALTISEPERLGASSGAPYQSFELANRPLYKRPGGGDPYGHLTVEVREPELGGKFGGWTAWKTVADFPEEEGNYFRLNPITGTISFGNGSHGRIPPEQSEIRAATYRYVAGGAQGNVPAGAVNVLRNPLANIVGVANPVPGGDGLDEEAVEETRRRAPELLRNRYRAVTVEDYEYLAREASQHVARVRALPARLFTPADLPDDDELDLGDPWTYGGLNRNVGHVNVIIIPTAPLADPAPRPGRALLQEVRAYLEQRRVMGTALHVTGPRYLPIRVELAVTVWKRAVDSGLVPDPNRSDAFRDEIAAAITRFLHPIVGGAAGQGWEIGANIAISSLLEVIQPDPAVGFVTSIKLAHEEPDPALARPPGLARSDVWVQLADHEIVRSAPEHAIAVSVR